MEYCHRVGGGGVVVRGFQGGYVHGVVSLGGVGGGGA